MMKILKTTAAIALSSSLGMMAACGGGGQPNTSNGEVATPADTSVAVQRPAPHHSALAGAVVGGVVGHELGHHAVAGAAAGALIQHHRNKKARY